MKNKPLKIIIEGGDCVGKSTLIKKLHKYYGEDITNKIHLSYRDPTNYAFYNNLLDINRVIFDRHFISELIYPAIYNRERSLSRKDSDQLIKKCKNDNIIILILTADDKTLLKRLRKRKNEETDVINNILVINAIYQLVGEKFNIPIIDTTKITFKKIIKIIEEEKIYEKYKSN